VQRVDVITEYSFGESAVGGEAVGAMALPRFSVFSMTCTALAGSASLAAAA